ncbi:M-phase inducer phosphatase [Candida viswanathii]|uniref:M-phase inducer phosphatase n=1 Tax=Candida viswanathii TaxID=5486 RepID=A0A367YHK7_9ASCO|nr:M-phase inducer phosphatase [Candida viswanathii]
MLHNDNIIQTLLNDSTTNTEPASSITKHHNRGSVLRVKRDRPASPFIDEFDSEMSSYSSTQTSVPDSPPDHALLPENDYSSINGKQQAINFSRVPLKNLSNLVIPSSVKSKTKQFTNSLSRSMSEVVSKSSHSFFNTPRIEFNSIGENDDIPTNYDSDEDDEDAKDNNDEDDEDDGEDTFETINIGSPIRRNASSNSNQHHGLFNDQPSKIRRFHSMYQTNKEIASYEMHEDNSILKFTNIEFQHLDSDLLPRITVDQLFKILCGDHGHEFDEFIIIDCRFDYEYEGGHIVNAINISSKEVLESTFLKDQQEENNIKRLIIFHCEFSVFRGPTMAKHLRRCDRMQNYDNYPRLTYPDIVILEGGYKRFYESYSQLCSPQGYIEMKQHEQLCESNLDKIRKENKLTRHKSYQFGSNGTMYSSRNTSSKDQLFWASGASSHYRSQSFTTITNEKIIKRQRSIPKVRESSSPTPPPPAPLLPPPPTPGNTIHRLTRANTISLDQPMFTNKLISSPVTSPTTGSFEFFNNSSSSSLFTQDFQPPSASFRNPSYRGHRKSISSNFSSTSINSITSVASSTACSDSGSIESSLTEPYTSSSSPVIDSADSFDARKPSRPQFHRRQGSRNIQQSQSQPQLQFQFPKSRSSSKLFSTPSSYFTSPSASTGTSNNNSNNGGGPMHSPFLTPATTSCDDTSSSIIDPINDTPVDFLVPILTHKYSKSKLHKRSGSLLSSTISENREMYSFAVDEEE